LALENLLLPVIDQISSIKVIIFKTLWYFWENPIQFNIGLGWGHNSIPVTLWDLWFPIWDNFPIIIAFLNHSSSNC